ncbi:MAG: cysteine--tRNA ligase, partial [Candidatus Dojkabacteria bacterium]|nr:cysteine--tRNA ligase [Candidatus Dojkabacteria bacterium]
FRPINNKRVGMYTCGPTVYDYTHIGHARKYILDDLIKRSLLYLGYKVKHVMNITDVGHLTSDQDEGYDKIEAGANKYNKSVWEIIKFFTEDFLNNLSLLNILKPNIICKATDHIKEQIRQIQKLLNKKYAYDTPEAVYFDTKKFKRYFKLFGQNPTEKLIAAREEVNTGNFKKNPTDFVLWFKAVGRFENHIMRWESPWGVGFPGWHIECSAMSMKYLGEQFDIHTGGIDHISVHHPNEIAQSECATCKTPFVKYWIHHNFLLVENEKMSKSKGNVYRLVDLIEKGYDPMHLRYYFLQTSYRNTLNFTFTGLEQAKNSYERLINLLTNMYIQIKNKKYIRNIVLKKYKTKFTEAIEEDFNFPKAISIVWETVKSDLAPDLVISTVINFDKVLGLKIKQKIIDNVAKIKQAHKLIKKERLENLLKDRMLAKQEKNWKKADEIRNMLKNRYNIEIIDTESGYYVKLK